jgi:lipopolysaccharide biosynthesis protein
MRRLAIFAHYDERADVKRYVLHHLSELGKVCDSVWFVSMAGLSGGALEKVRPFCARAWVCDNRGFDFTMWRDAIARIDPLEWDEIVLTNSSVFGPVWPLEEHFARMSRNDCDFWGMTENIELGWHLQSYFLVFRRKLIDAPAFRAFWQGVLPFRDKDQVIRSYEVGLSQYFVDEGFRAAAFAPLASLPKRPLLHRLFRSRFYQPMIVQPLDVLARRVPYVKLQLLRDNPMNRPLGPVRRAMARASYDLSLIEIDPRPRAPKISALDAPPV